MVKYIIENMANGSRKHYKRGYMELDKKNKKVDNHSNRETKPVSQEKFDKIHLEKGIKEIEIKLLEISWFNFVYNHLINKNFIIFY